jgi:outer membrane protein assembly factor BamD (BamD/ComL family)
MLGRRLFWTVLFLCGAQLAGTPSAVGDERTEFPAKARQLYQQGNDLQKQGKPEEALRAYDEAIKQGMEAFPRVHLQRARALMDLRSYDTAIAQFSRFIDQFGLENSCRY